MITINADRLQDGLYNIKNGKIFKYKAKGGTVRTYEMGEVVRCKDCKYGEKRIEDYRCWMLDEDWDIRFSPMHFCSYGRRREDGEA